MKPSPLVSGVPFLPCRFHHSGFGSTVGCDEERNDVRVRTDLIQHRYRLVN